MQNLQEVSRRFNAVQDEYKNLRQHVGLQTLKEIHEQAAKAFVSRHLEACLEQCKEEDGFFVEAVRAHIQLLQLRLR